LQIHGHGGGAYKSAKENGLKIILIYPGLVDGFNSYDKGSNWFNHGLGIISTILKGEGHIVHYLDCRKLKGWHEVSRRINEIDFDVALVSVATVDFEASQRIARIIKEKDSTIKIMVGGPHPTLMTEETATVKDFDFVFTHEAEITLPKIIAELEYVKSLSRADYYTHRHTLISRVVRGEMPPDLDALPFVDRSLAHEGETPMFRGLQTPYFAITASRGCFGKCTFCQPAERAVFGNKVRKRSAENVLTELTILKRTWGMKDFMIHDDCFTMYPSWVSDFCDKKIADPELRDAKFACQSRADIICRNPELIKKLRDAGLMWVLVGFESGSNRVLKFIKKEVTVEQNLEAARILRSLGIKIFANYMMGLPTETLAEMRETVAMILEMKPDWYSPAVFTPAPGSELYQYCIDNDLMLMHGSDMYRRTAFSGAKIKGVNYRLVNWYTAESLHGKIKGPIYFFLRSFAERLHGGRFYNFLAWTGRKINH